MHILTGNMFLLLLLLRFQIFLQLLGMFRKLHQMLRQPLLDLRYHLLLLPRVLLRGLAHLQQQSQHHRIIRRLAGSVSRRGIWGGAGLQLVDEAREIDEGLRGGGELGLDGLEARVYNGVAGDFGVEG